MNDLTKTPLDDKQVAALAKIGVPLFHDSKSKRTYVSRGYWGRIHHDLQRALSNIADEVRGTVQ